MTKLFTLKEIGAAIADAENRKDQDKIYQQLRGAVNRNLLVETDTYGPKGALRFDIFQVAKGRILLRAIDSGVTGDALSGFLNSISLERRALLPNGSNRILSLEAATKGAELENWEIELVEARDIANGKIEQIVTWLVGGSRFGANDPFDPNSFIPGMIIEEVRRLSFSSIVAPLFQTLRKAIN